MFGDGTKKAVGKSTEKEQFKVWRKIVSHVIVTCVDGTEGQAPIL
jgi:hypothetical protein